ncbi:MAG TPA: hypothetical protein VF998_02760 [Candidatus Limnocylindria bacterium]
MVSPLAPVGIAPVARATAASISPATLPRRFAVYLRERFPPAQYAFAVAIFYFAAVLSAARLAGAPPVTPAVLAGLATVFLVFLHLRLMDELKDADLDERLYPTRPVPRGLITLGELRAVGGLVILLEVALNIGMPASVLLPFLVALAFTFLMYAEFFAGRRLRANFLVYTLMHMPVLPLLAAYAYATVLAGGPPGLSAPFGLFLVASYAGGLTLEVARKIHAPRAEPAEAYSYSKHLGTRGVSDLLIGLVAAGTLSTVALGALLGFGVVFITGVALVAAGTLLALLRFRLAPTERLAAALGTSVLPASVLGPYALLIVAAIVGGR